MTWRHHYPQAEFPYAGASHQTGWTALVADLIIRSVTG
jgi:hypothetical protein